MYLHTRGDTNWETTLGWITEIGKHIYQKADGTKGKRERCRRLDDQKITMHREITPTAISEPRFHAPLHISPHPLAQQVRRAPEGEGALAGGI